MTEQTLPTTYPLLLDGGKLITLHTFAAMQGHELNRRYRTDYKLSNDRDVRRAFTLDVLEHAEYEGQRLGTVEAANNILVNWKNVQAVFHAVLEFNEVDLELSEEKARWFGHAGEELATSFIAAATVLMKPAIEMIGEPMLAAVVARATGGDGKPQQEGTNGG